MIIQLCDCVHTRKSIDLLPVMTQTHRHCVIFISSFINRKQNISQTRDYFVHSNISIEMLPIVPIGFLYDVFSFFSVYEPCESHYVWYSSVGSDGIIEAFESHVVKTCDEIYIRHKRRYVT